MQVTLLDCFVWSSLPFQTADICCHASKTKPVNIPEHAQSLITSCQEWQKTLATAAAHFLVYETAEMESELLTSTCLNGLDGAVISLGIHLTVSKNDTLINHIEQNFISAAIALCALAEVSLHTSCPLVVQ